MSSATSIAAVARSWAWTTAIEVAEAEVPLAEMFGYATSVRSMSQGRATYTMEFAKYQEVPANVSQVLLQRNS